MPHPGSNKRSFLPWCLMHGSSLAKGQVPAPAASMSVGLAERGWHGVSLARAAKVALCWFLWERKQLSVGMNACF